MSNALLMYRMLLGLARLTAGDSCVTIASLDILDILDMLEVLDREGKGE
jgi:hypothetical protein